MRSENRRGARDTEPRSLAHRWSRPIQRATRRPSMLVRFDPTDDRPIREHAIERTRTSAARNWRLCRCVSASERRSTYRAAHASNNQIHTCGAITVLLLHWCTAVVHTAIDSPPALPSRRQILSPVSRAPRPPNSTHRPVCHSLHYTCAPLHPIGRPSRLDNLLISCIATHMLNSCTTLNLAVCSRLNPHRSLLTICAGRSSGPAGGGVSQTHANARRQPHRRHLSPSSRFSQHLQLSRPLAFLEQLPMELLHGPHQPLVTRPILPSKSLSMKFGACSSSHNTPYK